MYSKTSIYNLALGSLLLTKKIVNADTDTSTEKTVFDSHWDTALESTLEDLDLNATVKTATLELLIAAPNTLWGYAYKYPATCIFLRRLVSPMSRDTRDTRIPLRVGIHLNEKVIFTNEASATVEFIPSDLNLLG